MSTDIEMKRPSFQRGNPQTQLLNAIRQQDLRVFKKLMASGSVDPDHFYEYPDYKTCMDIACSHSGTAEFIKMLMAAGVNVNKINETHRKAPIHFAAETGDVDSVKVLLTNKKINVNLLSKSNTALQLTVKKAKAVNKDSVQRFEDIITVLLKNGADPNIPDMKNSTAILFAAKNRLENIVKLILTTSKKTVDLDSHEDAVSQKTARVYIQENFPNLLEILPENTDDEEEEKPIDVSKLFALCNAHDEDMLVAALNSMNKNELAKIINEDNGYFTMLQICSKTGMDKAAEILLKYGADPTKKAPGSKSPAVLACINGYHRVLRLLLEKCPSEFDSSSDSRGDTLLQVIVRENKIKDDDPNSDYVECLDILLDSDKTNSDINHTDTKGNTALHYAVRYGDDNTVLKLLEKGACIGLRNAFNDPPLADISAKTLETHLNNCITTNGERPNDEDFEILIDYSFLVPPTYCSQNETKVPLIDYSNRSQSDNDKFLAPETDALLYMAMCPELKHLLKHPVITSFLFLKWQRISCLFCANIAFYALFWLSLLVYILLGYVHSDEKTEAEKTLGDLTYVTTAIGWIILTLREVSQMIVTLRRYLKGFENWLEIGLIIITGIILFTKNTEENTKQQLSAIAILLSSAELVLLIGQFPAFSTNIEMLKTVSWNFFKFILWYCILIIAFALSFYTLFKTVQDDSEFHDEKIPHDPNKTEQKNEEDPNFFVGPWISLFKTIVMLTGEFDANSIKFENFPVTSHIIFIIFVFMIPIVLFNLLNGLAVSDTQAIKENAELVGHISRIKLISYFENVVLGDMSPYKNATAQGENGCCWMPGANCMKTRLLVIKPLARRICLFPNYLPNAQIGIKTNDYSKVIIHKFESTKTKQSRDADEVSPNVTLCCLRTCSETIMDRNVVKAARMLIAEREENRCEMNQTNQRLANIEKKLEESNKAYEKLEELLKNLNKQ